jgi:hypothetical protein
LNLHSATLHSDSKIRSRYGILLWGSVSVTGMQTISAIIYLDIPEYSSFGFIMRLKMLVVKPFLFQFTPEVLRWSIMPTVAFPAHRTDKIIFLHQFLIVIATILATLIRAMLNSV